MALLWNLGKNLVRLTFPNITKTIAVRFQFIKSSRMKELDLNIPIESDLIKVPTFTKVGDASLTDLTKNLKIIQEDNNTNKKQVLHHEAGYKTKAQYKKFAQFVQPQVEQEFLEVLPSIIEDLTNLEEFKGLSRPNDRVRRILEYNLMPCTNFCAMFFLASHEHFRSAVIPETSVKNQIQNMKHLGYVLAWCTEMITASFFVLDDIIDGSKLRYGQPCWYTQDMNRREKMSAVYDALILERCTYAMLHRYLEGHPMHFPLVDLLRRVLACNNYSMALEGEINSTFVETGRTCSMKEYCKMRKWQNGFILFYLPIAAAAVLNGITQPEVLKQLESVCLDISLHFAIWKDHGDCFQETEPLGDEGSDIVNGKITWLLLIAMEHGTPQQRRTIQDNIGKPLKQNSELVMSVYREIGVSRLLKQWEKQLYAETVVKISLLSPELPQEYLKSLLHLISFHLLYS